MIASHRGCGKGGEGELDGQVDQKMEFDRKTGTGRPEVKEGKISVT